MTKVTLIVSRLPLTTSIRNLLKLSELKFPIQHPLQLLKSVTQLPALPFAAIMAYNQKLSTESDWLIVSPIQLAADQYTVYAKSIVSLTPTETSQLAVDFNQFFNEDSIVFHALENMLLLEIKNKLTISTTSVYEILGNDMGQYLPAGKDKTYWHKLFTEIELFLYPHAINARRTAQELPSIGALWFWGEGKLIKPLKELPWQTVYTDSEWLLQFGQYNQWETIPITDFYSLAQNIKPNSLVVIDKLLELQPEQQFAYLNQLEQQFFMQLARNKTLSPIVLYPGDGNCYDLQQSKHPKWHKWFHRDNG